MSHFPVVFALRSDSSTRVTNSKGVGGSKYQFHGRKDFVGRESMFLVRLLSRTERSPKS